MEDEGDVKEGDVKEGDVKEGDVKEGDVKEGDVKEGDVKEGDVNEGDVSEGDADEGDWNSHIIEEFRANSGKVGGEFEGVPLLLLTTTGAKSGEAHTTPLIYLPYGDRLTVFASNSGAPRHPDWYFNLLAKPLATVEVRHKMFNATATPAEGEFRDDLFAQQCHLFPIFAEDQRKAGRKIPAIMLRMKGQPPR